MTPELKPSEQPACILVVEDEVLLRAVLAWRLRMKGLRVVEAADAREAWSYLQAGGRADLMFSDIQMAGPMNGLELARRVRAAHPSVRVVLTSGTMPPQGAIDPGSFIPKPYPFPQIVTILSAVLGLADPDEA